MADSVRVMKKLSREKMKKKHLLLIRLLILLEGFQQSKVHNILSLSMFLNVSEQSLPLSVVRLFSPVTVPFKSSFRCATAESS